MFEFIDTGTHVNIIWTLSDISFEYFISNVAAIWQKTYASTAFTYNMLESYW